MSVADPRGRSPGRRGGDPGRTPTSHFHGHGRAEVTLPEELEPVEAHRDRILGDLSPLEPVDVDLSEVSGLVLAEDVVVEEPLPPFASSAMDGYALVAADAAGAAQQAPVWLPVDGEVPAGPGTPDPLTRGRAVRIMTGATVPDGADAVVPVEQTREKAGVVGIYHAPTPGDYIRPAGDALAAGTPVLSAGRQVRPGDVGVLAAVGRARLRCYPRPRVVVMSTGSELVPVGEPLKPGTIRDVNGPMLTALVRDAGAAPVRAGIVGDDRHSLAEAVDANVEGADLMITTGGVSAGAHDHVWDVLARLGDVHHTKVAMKPGMPQVYGRVRGVPVFGLPGNPVSSFVSFEVFVRPALRRLLGHRDLHRPAITARLEEPMRAAPHKRTFLRVDLRRTDKGWVARSAGGQGSHQLGALVRADGLAEIPEGTVELGAGDRVTVRLLVDA